MSNIFKHRPVIVGLNNPHSNDPAMALGVEPAGAAGARLWLMLKTAANNKGKDLRESDYLETFDRRNLIDEVGSGENFSSLRDQFLVSLKNKTVVVCGTRVAHMMKLKHTGFTIKGMAGPDFAYFIIPHPSGLCREYNNPEMRARVGDLLLKLHEEYRRG